MPRPTHGPGPEADETMPPPIVPTRRPVNKQKVIDLDQDTLGGLPNLNTPLSHVIIPHHQGVDLQLPNTNGPVSQITLPAQIIDQEDTYIPDNNTEIVSKIEINQDATVREPNFNGPEAQIFVGKQANPPKIVLRPPNANGLVSQITLPDHLIDTLGTQPQAGLPNFVGRYYTARRGHYREMVSWPPRVR